MRGHDHKRIMQDPIWTGARILAIGGTAASLLTMIGGMAGQTTIVGMAGAVMLSANLLAAWRG